MYDFSVDYKAFDIVNIHKYLMKKTYKIMFGLTEKNIYWIIN